MTFFIAAYLAGVLTIATPCIFPILPFVLARADPPFRQGGLPILLGLAITFAAVASLASAAGGWAVQANHYGRIAALAVMALFGLSMLLPGVAAWAMRPIVSIGSQLADRAHGRIAAASSLLLGVATGLLWAPCAGPVLGLILTGAALHGPSLETSLLLAAYAAGAATSLAAGLLLGGRLLVLARRIIPWGDAFRRILGAAVVAGVAAIGLRLDTGALTRWSSATADQVEHSLLVLLRQEPPIIIHSAGAAASAGLPAALAPLLDAGQWLNAPPPQAQDLRGKVVLINFWTYSCINCLRVLPHVRAWAETYRDRGLVVIGVHTPEFAFEKHPGNIRKALSALGVTYPVAVDSDSRIWRAFDNRAWPALYFIGADGRIRDRVLGEGRFDQSEQLIQRLLTEAIGPAVAGDVAAVSGEGTQAPADPRNLRSGETYIGYARASGFASPGGARHDVPSLYRSVPALPLNTWAVSGAWTIGSEFATLNEPGGRVTYRFHARDLHLVLVPPATGQTIRFRVTLDGAAPSADHGSDVDAEGWGSVQDGRLYQLIRQNGSIADRTFEIEFFDPGVRAYAFTFG